MTQTVLDLAVSEWEKVTPQSNAALRNLRLPTDAATQRTILQLTQSNILQMVEMRDGLAVQAFSHVGRIQIGEVSITVRPKIAGSTLLHLLRYAYDLRHLTLFENVTFDSETDAFQDLLLYQLAHEVSELMARGLQRKYQRQEEYLASPRGAIDIRKLARSGGMGQTTLPCVYYPRALDVLPNQVLLSGIEWGANTAQSPLLKVKLRRIAGQLRQEVKPVPLNGETFRRLRVQSNRLFAAYQPASTLIELLLASAGVSLEPETDTIELPGFLFDMNRFFQALLSRFLNENLPDYVVQDEKGLSGVITYNPHRRSSPSPRPDYIVLQDGMTVAILDAKYRDLWAKPLPRDMLYQLAMYALLGGCKQGAVILYPTLEERASEQRLDIRKMYGGAQMAQVILRPVQLQLLENLVGQKNSIQGQRERFAYARKLAFGNDSNS